MRFTIQPRGEIGRHSSPGRDSVVCNMVCYHSLSALGSGSHSFCVLLTNSLEYLRPKKRKTTTVV